MGKNTVIAALLLSILLTIGAAFAQGGSGSDWQYCNAFNVVTPEGTPGGPDYGDNIPSWYTTDYTTVSSFTPASTWRRASFLPVGGGVAEEPVRMSHENVVLRLDLLSGTDNVELRGVKLNLFGSRDFDPNEDFAPIHPESTAIHYSIDVTEADTLTGVQFYIDKGVSALSDVDILDRVDIMGIAEQLITDTLIQPRDTYDPSSPSHTEDTLLEGNKWSLDSTAANGWKWWSATFYFEDAINIPYEATFNSALYGLPFYRIWIALQMAGCHECGIGDPEIGGIEGISNSDSFYVEIAERGDLICYRYNPPIIDLVDMTSTLTDVLHGNPFPDPATASRWARSEMIKGWDEIPPFINQLWPRNLISTNDWYSDSVLCGEINDSIFTADEEQPISITTQDLGTCVDSAFMEIRYINDEFYGTSPGSQFPGRIDSIIWVNPLEYAYDDTNGGNETGWIWQLKHCWTSGGPWSTTGWTTLDNIHSEAFADWIHPECGTDSFVVMVGNDTTTRGTIVLPMFDDGAYVQVLFRCFSRTNNFRYDYGWTLSPGVMNDTIWTFKVDLSGPNAELNCPSDEGHDNETREFAGANVRRDLIEGQFIYWRWIADSLPTLLLDVYDDYHAVHDRTNHGINIWPGGVGGAGINWRDFEITFAIEHCSGDWDTIIVNETDIDYGVSIDEENNGYDARMWINFEELVLYHPSWVGLVPFASGDFVYVLLTELVDDPDYGQRWDTCMIGDWTLMPPYWNQIAWVIDEFPSGSWGIADGADGNYGTRNTQDNHVPVIWETVGMCSYYTEFAYDTLGILRIDLEGPTAPDTFYYPPHQWVTSDSFQIITLNIYDQIDCSYFDLDVEDELYNRVSGIYSGSLDEEARLCMNLKVRGCDGTWHPYYHTLPTGSIPDGRNFCVGEPDAVGLNLTKKWNEWGLRVTWDPYRTDTDEAHFRPGDKVCVTVYAWDNAITDCQSEDGIAGPISGWDDDNDPWTPAEFDSANYSLWCSDGSLAEFVDCEVPSRNSGYDRLDPDYLYYTISHIARWTFFVDCHAPIFTGADMSQVCNDTMYMYFHDVSANVHDVYCDEWIANIGVQHTELVEGADLLLIFTDTMTTPGVTYVDTVIFQDMKLSGGAYPLDIHIAYHDIPTRGYQYYYAELIKDPDDDRGAYVQLYGDGTEATCHFFQPYDQVVWELYAGDSPDVPWYPASQRTVSGGTTYRWWHTYDSWSNPGTWFMSWRYGAHDYTDINVDTLDWTFWLDTTYDDFENPNWDLIQVDSFQIFPQTWLAKVSWFNDEAYDAYMYMPHTYNYPPDLKGDYINVWHNWMARYINLDPPGMEPSMLWEEGDSSIVSAMEARDPYVNFWVNDLNFIVADIYTCTDSIIWECLVGTDPDEDTLPFRVPRVTIDLYDASRTLVWTVDEFYDCHCTPCFLSYLPERTACVDWGRLYIGPIDQTDEWLTTIRAIDTLETDPALVTDTIYGWQHYDSISVRFEFNVREPNYFTHDSFFTKYVFRWDYVVDMQPPTAIFRDPDATTGYNEVNCNLIHDSNHDIRLRLDDIVDAHVGCAPGTLIAPTWTTQWPIPAVDPTSDFVKYELGTMPPVDANMVWNPASHFIWTNEMFVIENCAPEDEVADTMTIGTPGIEIYHGLDRAGASPVPVETHLDIDTIFIADSVYAEAIIQDRLGNWALKTSRKVGLDNGLPELKGFAIATVEFDTIGYEPDSTAILSDPYLNNWNEDLFKLPWMVPDQDSIVGIYNFTDVCTVYIRLWFNDNMDMRDADHLYGHIVRFKPFGWTAWFPVLPLETVGGGPSGLHYPLAQRYVDYRDIAGVMPSARPGMEVEISDESPLVPGGVMSLDNGWNSDREWIGYMVVAGGGAMDGIGKLRVQGFDDNAGNYMLPIELPLRIVTGDPEYRELSWPWMDTLDIDHTDPWSGDPDDQLVLTGWSTSDPLLADSTRCSFYEDEDRLHEITAYWDNELAETDSVRFLVWWHDDLWIDADIVYSAYTFRWLEDDMYSSTISIYGNTTWVNMPTDELDLLHEWCPSLGTFNDYSNNEKYATILFEGFSRFRPTNPYIADTLLNVRIDNQRPDPELTTLTGGQMIHPCHTVLPFGSTALKVCWENNQVEQIDKMSIWLHNLIDDTNWMIYPVGGAPGLDFAEVGVSAPLYYDPVNEVICLDFEDPAGLPNGMWTLSWKAFDGIQVVDTSETGVITNYWQYYHTDCEHDIFDSDTLVILRPPFLARGDDIEDALMSVSENYPAVMRSQDIFPWWNDAMEDLWPDWPTWGYIDTAEIAAAGLPDIYRVDSLHRVPQIMPVVQVTTYNNPDYSSGSPDPLMHPYTESGGYPGDSIYVLLEKLPTDLYIEYIELNIQDYWGGNISGSNLEINVTLDDLDLYTALDGREYWVYKWDVDDQDNRYDGLVTITATEYTYSPAAGDTNYWDHIAYVFLDTYDPLYEVTMLRVSDGLPANIAINPIDYPTEEYIWVVNCDEFIIGIDWDETIFDPASPGSPSSYYNYGNYVYTRMWDHMRITIDGMPHYGTDVDDANDHLEARLWDDNLDAWDIHHPFWRQPDYMNGAMTPSSYDDATMMFTFDDKLDFFADDISEYAWEIAGIPEGLDGQGIAHLLAKGRDAAGNVLDYFEALLSDSKGKFALIDIEAPTIDSSEVLATGENLTVYTDGIWDNFIDDNFTDELGNGYVYVMVTIDTVGGTAVVGPFWVDETGAIATIPWGAIMPTPGDVVTVCAYDLAGNETCIDVDVVPEMHCCTWDLCDDWNLVGLSVDPGPMTVDSLFEGLAVYELVGGVYIPVPGTDMVIPGMGYAVYPPADMEIVVCGAPVESFDVTLEAGWNLIGSTWEDVLFTSPDTDPVGAIDITETRWYDCGLDYVETESLFHCRGHLVMVTEPTGCDLSVPGARGGKVVYTVKDGEFIPAFTGRLVTDKRTLTFGAADIASENYDRGIDHFAVPARPGESMFTLGSGLDTDYRATDSRIEWTVVTTASYSATLELEGNWEVSYEGVKLENGDVVEITPGSHKLVADRVAIPEAFALGQNLPNPFNAVTAIKYELPENSKVTLEVYTVLGNKVATLVNGEQEAGFQTVIWDGMDDEGRPVSSGIYFYKMSAGDFKATRKMTLMK